MSNKLQLTTISRAALALVIAVGLTVTAYAGSAASTVSALGTTGAFRPVTPCRLLNQRAPDLIPGGRSVTVLAATQCGVPANATAVAMSVVAVRPVADGFLTIWPSGTPQPNTSNANYAAQELRTASSIASLGADGAFQVYTHAATGLVIDVSGYWIPAASASAGRFVPAERRAWDTRERQRLARGDYLVLSPAQLGVPANAQAVAVNLTIVQPEGASWIAAYPTGTPWTNTSNGNTEWGYQTRASLSIVPMNSAGINVYAANGMDLVVDVAGYFTGAAAPDSSGGLLVTQSPNRVLDTRSGAVGTQADGAVVAPVGGVGVTILSVTQLYPGWRNVVTVGTQGPPRPATSAVNIDRHGAVANLAFVQPGVSGSASYVAAWSGPMQADVLIDQIGSFTPSAAPIVGTGPTGSTADWAPALPPLPPGSAPDLMIAARDAIGVARVNQIYDTTGLTINWGIPRDGFWGITYWWEPTFNKGGRRTRILILPGIPTEEVRDLLAHELAHAADGSVPGMLGIPSNEAECNADQIASRWVGYPVYNGSYGYSSCSMSPRAAGVLNVYP